MSLLLKVTAEQLYSHGDGALPARGNDPDEPGEDGWADVVPHRAIVIHVPDKPLHSEKKKDKERKKFRITMFSLGDLQSATNNHKQIHVCVPAIKLFKTESPLEHTLDVCSSSSVYCVQRMPSSLYSRAKETTYIFLPVDLAPCVMMPVIFLTWVNSIWSHWFMSAF